MKIAIGFNIVNRAWGGGNQFVKSLREYLENKGHLVVHDLKSNDIDIILIIDPDQEFQIFLFNRLYT